jgi:phage-related protein
MPPKTRNTRPISWIVAARKEFEAFPEEAQSICMAALTIAAEGGKADIARGDAFRVVYAVQLADEIWVAPQSDIDLVKYRLKRLKEVLQ